MVSPVLSMHALLSLLFSAPLLAAGLPSQASSNPLDDYEPPVRPRLSGNDAHRTLSVNGRDRSLLYYVPKGITPEATVVILHGTTGCARRIRDFTAYKFDELADQHGYVAIYPEAISGIWDDCRTAGRRPPEDSAVDDAAFLCAAVQRVSQELGVEGLSHFLAGYSGGGHLAFRIAMRNPEQFRAYAIFAASLPAPGDFNCPEPKQAVSLLLMNGTDDPVNPFSGGEVVPPAGPPLGKVRSTRATADYFAGLAGASGAPTAAKPAFGLDGTSLEEITWKGKGHEVKLVIVSGGGHSLPHPTAEFPRAAGPTSKSASGAEIIWSFFERRLKLI
jgi:polyhydroxybutyrate depolymerase